MSMLILCNSQKNFTRLISLSLQMTISNSMASNLKAVVVICDRFPVITIFSHQSAAARSGLQQVTARTRVRRDVWHNPENFQSRGLTSARKSQRKKKNGRAANPAIFSFPLGAAQQHSALRRGRNSPSFPLGELNGILGIPPKC